MKFFLSYTAILFLLFGVFLVAEPAFAQSASTSEDGVSSKIIPSELLSRDPETFRKADNINVFIVLAINIGLYLFGFIGALALLFFVYGGVILIISQGNQEKIKQGTSAMTAAIIGLIIAFSAYALVSFLGSTIGVKAEKSLNFIDVVYAQDDNYGETPKTCMEPIGCYCDAAAGHVSGEIYAIAEGDICYGNLTYEAPVSESIDEYLGETPGEEGESGEGVSVLKKGAAKLNPMNIGTPTDLMARAINALIAFMGSIAIVFYVYAGFVWMSASGNTEKISKAKAILIWTTLGALAMGGSYMIVRTILQRIG